MIFNVFGYFEAGKKKRRTQETEPVMEKNSWGIHEASETSRGPSGDPPGTPGGPPRDPPGTSQGSPGDPPGTPRGSPGAPGGPPGTSRDPLWTPHGPLMHHKNGHISTNIQRQKLSIAVFEAAHQGPSHGGPDWAVLCIKRLPKPKKHPPGTGISQSRVRLRPYPCGVLIYIEYI